MKLTYADEMIEPPKCVHARTMQVSAKADDRQCYRVPHLGIDTDSYAPQIDGLCHGDYVDFTVCLDCGTVISMVSPVTDEDLYEAFNMDLPEGGEDDELLDAMGR
jgi:hypothetical protein